MTVIESGRVVRGHAGEARVSPFASVSSSLRYSIESLRMQGLVSGAMVMEGGSWSGGRVVAPSGVPLSLCLRVQAAHLRAVFILLCFFLNF